MEFTDKFMMTWSVFEGSQMNRLCLLSADMEFWLQCWTEPSPLVKGRWLMRNEVLIILQRHRHTHTHTHRQTHRDRSEMHIQWGRKVWDHITNHILKLMNQEGLYLNHNV